jgi:hypothetical protein
MRSIPPTSGPDSTARTIAAADELITIGLGEHPNRSELLGLFEAQADYACMKRVRREAVYALAGLSIPLGVLVLWPEPAPAAIREVVLLAWGFALLGTLVSAAVERWLHEERRRCLERWGAPEETGYVAQSAEERRVEGDNT